MGGMIHIIDNLSLYSANGLFCLCSLLPSKVGCFWIGNEKVFLHHYITLRSFSARFVTTFFINQTISIVTVTFYHLHDLLTIALGEGQEGQISTIVIYFN